MNQLWWRFVRFGFRLLYNELAFTYDWVSWFVSLGSWRCWQRSALKHLTPPDVGCVLELAHGTGNLQLDLREAGYNSIGLDLSPAMGRIASRKLAQHGVKSHLVRAQAQQLPFADTSFSAVISTFPTDFILAPETLREVHRVLVANGQFLIVPNGTLTGGDALAGLIEWLYKITGQREGKGQEWDVATFFAEQNFDAQIVTKPCPRSEAQVIVARKRV
ncbi:MAG: class I SAM-dependent methyltransferase [Anaerolineae bacterium]|nr:class I SAM-dependent methyltransferase [Anaerolineae bacterium]